MDLSYIVPAYNVGNYLERCLDSIYTQGLNPESFEVIIVEDGSTDNTGEIADKLAESGKYSNLRVIHQKNEGLSGARNTGIRHAKGEYIWCIDSDDMLVPNSVLEILSLCKDITPDIFFFELIIKDPNGSCHRSHHQPFPLKTIIKGADAIVGNFSPGSACSAFFRREFLIENNLKFYQGIYHEDVEFTYRAVALSDSVFFTDYAPYIYEKHPNTIMTAKEVDKIIKRLVDDGIIANSYRCFVKGINDKTVKSRFERQSLSIAMGTLVSLLKNNEHKNRYVRNSVINKYRELNLFPLKPPTNSLKHLALTTFLNLRFWNYGR